MTGALGTQQAEAVKEGTAWRGGGRLGVGYGEGEGAGSVATARPSLSCLASGLLPLLLAFGLSRDSPVVPGVFPVTDPAVLQETWSVTMPHPG